jgi:capsular exopolysaccharide synthesis family protein
VLTSPSPGGGTTLSAANLALALAREGERVLLVDADLHSGDLHSLLATPKSDGLSDILEGRVSLAAAVRNLPVPGRPGTSLHFIPRGNDVFSASELVSSEPMSRFVAEARSAYDRVVIDSPALQTAPDAVLLAAQGDAGVLVVVRSGLTDRRELQQGLAAMRTMQVAVGGIILNDVATSRSEVRQMPLPHGTGPASRP